MTQHPKQFQEDMNGSDNLIPNIEDGDSVERKIPGSDHVNGLQQSIAKPDSFVVNMERFSQLIDKDLNANSRIALQRSLSRKGSNRGAEKKIAVDDRDANTITSSPRATLQDSSMPEPVIMGASDHTAAPAQVHHHHHHHPITIPNSNTPSDSKWGGKRFGFRRSPQTWIIDPRRILFFFATLSCMGTVVLIYFTLSIGKPNEDENALN